MTHAARRRALVTALGILLAACGTPSEETGGVGDGGQESTDAAVADEELTSEAEGAQEADGFPVTVENCGRELTFDAPPERIVTDYQPVFETVVSLGLGDRIVGRTNFEENGPDGFLPGHKEVYDATTEISDTIDLPQKEVLLSQDADFVIAISYNSFDADSGKATVEELADAGTQAYIAAGWCDPQGVRESTVADVFDDVRNLGAIFGVPDRAAELNAELEGLIADVEERVDGLEPVAVLATDGGAGPVNAYGGSGLMNQMIEIAGGRNVLADVDEDYTEVSVETVAASQPEAMIVLDYDQLFGEENLPSAQEKAETVFELIPDSAAAEEQRFLPIPAAAAHSGYRNILAIPEIAEFLHPEAFAG